MIFFVVVVVEKTNFPPFSDFIISSSGCVVKEIPEFVTSSEIFSFLPY
jgi:hypothetical protein